MYKLNKIVFKFHATLEHVTKTKIYVISLNSGGLTEIRFLNTVLYSVTIYKIR